MKDEVYLHRHRFLHMIWRGNPEFFAVLSFDQQRAIHDYYRPSGKLTDDELLAHRTAIPAEEPLLPARAGQAFKRLDTIYRQAKRLANGDPVNWRPILFHYRHGTIGAPGCRLRLRTGGLARSTVDSYAIAHAIVQQVNEELAQPDARLRDRSATPSSSKVDRTRRYDTPNSVASTEIGAPAA